MILDIKEFNGKHLKDKCLLCYWEPDKVKGDHLPKTVEAESGVYICADCFKCCRTVQTFKLTSNDLAVAAKRYHDWWSSGGYATSTLPTEAERKQIDTWMDKQDDPFKILDYIRKCADVTQLLHRYSMYVLSGSKLKEGK